jgi:hypothetical protein
MSKSEDAVAGRPGQRKICRWCIHYRMRNEWDQQRSQRAFQEKEPVLGRLTFAPSSLPDDGRQLC